MGGLDALLLVIIGASAVFGLLRGFVGVVASIAAWLLGGWAALEAGGPVARMLAGGEPDATQLLLGYGGCFIAVSAGIALLAWLTRRMLAGAGLGGVDRGLGLALGLVRGALGACVLVLLMGFTHLPREAGWQQSMLVPLFKPGAHWLAGWLPQWAAARLDLDGRTESSTALPAPV